MVYDEGLAERIRSMLTEEAGVSEKRMFGGLAFLIGGNMSVGVVKDELMVRVGPAYDELIGQPHARKMDFTGKPMKGFFFGVPMAWTQTRTSRVGWDVGWRSPGRCRRNRSARTFGGHMRRPCGKAAA